MPNTTAYSFGDVVLVPFPFTDQTASKKRPAVVVSADAYHQRRPDVIVMAVTSQILRPAGALGEVLISDWQGAGLPKPSSNANSSTSWNGSSRRLATCGW